MTGIKILVHIIINHVFFATIPAVLLFLPELFSSSSPVASQHNFLKPRNLQFCINIYDEVLYALVVCLETADLEHHSNTWLI